MKNIVKMYLDIIKNPLIARYYKNLALYYSERNLKEEEEAFMLLFDEYEQNSNTNSDEEQ